MGDPACPVKDKQGSDRGPARISGLKAGRIIFVSTEFPPGPGGIGTHAFQISKNLDRLGWKVLVVSPQDYVSGAEYMEFNATQPFQIEHLHRQSSPLAATAYRSFVLHKAIRSWKPDIVLASGVKAVWISMPAALCHRIPLVAIAHGGIEFNPRVFWVKALTRRSFNRADAIISVSEYTQSKMFNMGIRPKEAAVIHNGADHEAFHPLPQEQVDEFRERNGLKGRFVIFTAGSVSERKGQDVVIRALPDVLKKHPHIHYLMAGHPRMQKEFSGIAERIGVADNVRFLGIVDQKSLNGFYNVCDVFAMTSRHSSDGDSEGFGIAAVEAALCGKPAIASAGSGLEEAVEAGRTGLIVAEDSPDETADAIVRLIEDDSLRAALGSAGRERACSSLTWHAVAEKYSDYLKGFLALHRQGRT